MIEILNQCGTLVENYGNHRSYIVKWPLISPLCKKWNRNRDPDETRIIEMCDFYNRGGYIPHVIHLAELDKQLVCYDGNHRRTVFDRVENKSSVLIDVIFNATPTDIYEAFKNINKSVELPLIYVDNELDKVKEDILALVKQYETKYSAFLKTSPNCFRPNFNRDGLVQNITNIYNESGRNYTIKQIGESMEKLNEMYSKQILCGKHDNLPKTVITKCNKYGCWLFIKKQIPTEHIEYAMD